MEGIVENLEQCMNHLFVIVTILFIISEALAQIPFIKGNSIFQILYSVICKLNFLLGKRQIIKEKEVIIEGGNNVETDNGIENKQSN